MSAPLASIARRVSSKSLYFPVPINRRERIFRPATTKASSTARVSKCEAGNDISTPSYCNHDLELIALGQPGLRISAARHDLAILFNRDSLASELEVLQEPGEACACLDAAALTID